MKENYNKKMLIEIDKIIDNNKKLIVSCGDGHCVEILEVQLDGKKRMDTKSFLMGNKIEIGAMLGE